jgi:diadenosine tetraphosphate (Ap4A) HIT family hydrolase
MEQYESKTKEGNCIFCEILKGNIKTPGIFWEDKKHMAFLTPFPNTKGFTIVIPKKHFGSDVLNMPDKNLKELIMASKKVSNILMQHFEDIGRVGLMMEGTGIDHAHTKLFPMHGTEHMKKGEWKHYLGDKEGIFFENYKGYITSIEGPRVSDEEIKELAEKLKKVQIK